MISFTTVSESYQHTLGENTGLCSFTRARKKKNETAQVGIEPTSMRIIANPFIFVRGKGGILTPQFMRELFAKSTKTLKCLEV